MQQRHNLKWAGTRVIACRYFHADQSCLTGYVLTVVMLDVLNDVSVVDSEFAWGSARGRHYQVSPDV
jgi:hypothetical protein